MLALLRRHLPSQCAFCRAWPVTGEPTRVCQACWARFRPTGVQCLRCALPVAATATSATSAAAQAPAICGACVLHPPAFAQCVAAVPYAYPWQQVVAQLKFGADFAWAHTMAQILWQTPRTLELLQAADWLVPVPLSTPRLRERGYNQAALLARSLRQQAPPAVQCPVLQTGIARQHRVTPQAQLGRKARLKNLRGAFQLDAAAQRQLQGARVALVDDVKTTGATLETLAQACLAAGAKEVVALAFAVTPAPAWRD